MRNAVQRARRLGIRGVALISIAVITNASAAASGPQCEPEKIVTPAPLGIEPYNGIFGSKIRVSGDTLFISDRFWRESDLMQGRVCVFRRRAGAWEYAGDVPAPPQDGELFRYANGLDVSADYIVVGAWDFDPQRRGEVHVIRWSPDIDPADWTVEVVLRPTGEGHEEQPPFFGVSCAIDGNRIIVGADRDDGEIVDSGVLYIFDRIEGQWTQTARIVPPLDETESHFGHYVAVEGDVAVATAWSRGQAPRPRSAYIYERHSATGDWTLVRKLTTPPAALESLHFGRSLDLREGLLAIGSDDLWTPDARGAVYVYRKDPAGEWSLMDMVLPVSLPDGATFGAAALGENYLLVGASRMNVDVNPPGAVYVCRRVGDSFIVGERIESIDLDNGRGFGSIVATDGGCAVTADPTATGVAEWSGAVYTVADINSDGMPGGCDAPCTGDVDGDGVVGVTDLAAIVDAWGPRFGVAADLDGDEDVDARDLASLLGAWGACD